MAINDISAGNQAPPPITIAQPKSGGGVEVSRSLPKTRVEELSKVAESRKNQSMVEIIETADEIREAIEHINEVVKNVPTSLNFSVDEASDRFVVHVTDTDTGELIRKLPGDAVLRIARQLESLKGVVFDHKY